MTYDEVIAIVAEYAMGGSGFRAWFHLAPDKARRQQRYDHLALVGINMYSDPVIVDRDAVHRLPMDRLKDSGFIRRMRWRCITCGGYRPVLMYSPYAIAASTIIDCINASRKQREGP